MNPRAAAYCRERGSSVRSPSIKQLRMNQEIQKMKAAAKERAILDNIAVKIGSKDGEDETKEDLD